MVQDSARSGKEKLTERMLWQISSKMGIKTDVHIMFPEKEVCMIIPTTGMLHSMVQGAVKVR